MFIKMNGFFRILKQSFVKAFLYKKKIKELKMLLNLVFDKH
jgi:hypothetical protein